jgi:hypothetical protein
MADIRDFDWISSRIAKACKVKQPRLNVYESLSKSVSPPALVINPDRPTGDPMQTLGLLTEWKLRIIVVIGQVSEKSARHMAVSVINPLICAIEEADYENGYAIVTKWHIGETKIGQALHTYAQLSVTAKA